MKKILFSFLLFISTYSFSQSKTENFSMILHDDWRMQSSVTDHAKGDLISAENFDAKK